MTEQDIRIEAERRASDRTDQEIIRKTLDEGVQTVWDRFALQQPQCGFGQLGVCCNNCAMGPCRIDPFGGKTSLGVCGANVDTIVARNLLDDLSVGAAHSDHEGKLFRFCLKLQKVMDKVTRSRMLKNYTGSQPNTEFRQMGGVQTI